MADHIGGATSAWANTTKNMIVLNICSGYFFHIVSFIAAVILYDLISLYFDNFFSLMQKITG